jgi:hypothetical protein
MVRPRLARSRSSELAPARPGLLLALVIGAVDPVAGGEVPRPFCDEFSFNGAGWTLEQEWAIGATSASSGHNLGHPDPEFDSSPSSDNGVAGAVIGGNITTDLHAAYHLTSPAIDTSSWDEVRLDFQRWLNADQTPYMVHRIEVFDGEEWVAIFSTAGLPVTDSTWQPHSYDLSVYSNASLRVRFAHEVENNGALTVSGWNIDDLCIGPGPDLFADGFESGDFTAWSATVANLD